MSRRPLRREAELLRGSLNRINESAERWKGRYYAEHQRIVDLALEHSPKLRAFNEDDLPGLGKTISLSDDHQIEMSCTAMNCPYGWPCPTYLWATGSVPFKVSIAAKEVK